MSRARLGALCTCLPIVACQAVFTGGVQALQIRCTSDADCPDGRPCQERSGLCDTCEQVFGGKTLVDVEVGRRFGGMRWSLGARNLFDTYPDKNTLDNGYGIFPWAGASPFGYNGRFVYTRAEILLGR